MNCKMLDPMTKLRDPLETARSRIKGRTACGSRPEETRRTRNRHRFVRSTTFLHRLEGPEVMSVCYEHPARLGTHQEASTSGGGGGGGGGGKGPGSLGRPGCLA